MAAKLLTDLSKALRLGPRGWCDLARATLELAVASRQLVAHSASDLISRAREVRPAAASVPLSPHQRQMIARVALAIPRMGGRVPWRADCLVQALAARHWLARYGIASALCIGIRNEAEFEAHAWLKVGQDVVTGGDISSFAPLITPDREQAQGHPAPNGR